jgi:preprotein translocase subunit YajC
MPSFLNNIDPSQLAMIGVGFAVLYFLILRPKQKERNDKQTFWESLKSGSKVLTIGGIYGKVAKVTQDKVVLEIDKKGSQITLSREAIIPNKVQEEKKVKEEHKKA